MKFLNFSAEWAIFVNSPSWNVLFLKILRIEPLHLFNKNSFTFPFAIIWKNIIMRANMFIDPLTILRALYILSQSSCHPYEVGTLIILILQRREQRQRKVKCFAQDYIASV